MNRKEQKTKRKKKDGEGEMERKKCDYLTLCFG